MNAKRGYVPEDDRNFSEPAIETMRTASRHIRFLINEGYDLKQASTFVGNHYVLSERQRLALMRSIATDSQLDIRKAKENVITSDSIILDHCKSWINLMNKCVSKYGAKVVQVCE